MKLRKRLLTPEEDKIWEQAEMDFQKVLYNLRRKVEANNRKLDEEEYEAGEG